MYDRLEIREETPVCKLVALYDDGVRHSWHDTRVGALVQAHKLLNVLQSELHDAEAELVDAGAEVACITAKVLETTAAVRALEADPANR